MELLVSAPQGKFSFKLADKALLVAHRDTLTRTVQHHYVLDSHYDDEDHLMHVSYLIDKPDKKQGTSLELVKVTGTVQDEVQAFEWAEKLMSAVYEGHGIQRSRRLRVLVNPNGGVRKGSFIFSRIVEPIFRAARCQLHVTHTTHNGHAHDIAKDLATNYDAVVTVSGDGLIHEVLNGFAEHADPLKAFSIPVAPIPTGSGNGLSLNLLGAQVSILRASQPKKRSHVPQHGFDVTRAALNVIKGQPMKVDLFSFTQGDKRSISFMSQSLGLMADLDIGTEHLRWMGDTRFMVGLLRGIIQFRACPVQLSYKAAEIDKHKMAERVSLHRKNKKSVPPTSSSPATSESDITETLPPLKFQPEDNEGWTTIDEPLLYVYAGKGPFVGRDYMAFPVSLPDDGLIDVMAMPLSSRKDVIAGMAGAEKGESYWSPKLQYVKAHAYRVKPLKPKGHLAVDGEIYPFKEFQVEVHQCLGTLLSPYGQYAVEFAPHPPARNKKSKPSDDKKEGATRSVSTI
ncbi:hypothetical protein NP233_g5609 [Leucocoprinus birnbaumii]|uniref:DAGKc domain-containing protein n=1 Tax=Leucocoprinus birnbaumii TaxID=56174 RepID=A0AAD5VSW6_9AGAR|nr:hypothetical protein NP233_g5609 [Leucocoprinus birnbaumii]